MPQLGFTVFDGEQNEILFLHDKDDEDDDTNDNEDCQDNSHGSAYISLGMRGCGNNKLIRRQELERCC